MAWRPSHLRGLKLITYDNVFNLGHGGTLPCMFQILSCFSTPDFTYLADKQAAADCNHLYKVD